GHGSRGRAVSGVLVDPGTRMSGTDQVKSVVGPLTRTPSDQVPDVAALLFGPLLDGSVVEVK
ncbi:MAG: virulence factor Mce family protein, partial [Actinomadura rubrobrunea]|nr:virulence factor Mce family protein [Actinomadura rubrobrunea]